MTLHQEVARRVEELEADRITTWAAVCALDRWACLESDLPADPHEGDEGVVRDDDGVLRTVRIEEVEPGRRLAWRWRPLDGEGRDDDRETCVEVTLDDTGDERPRTRVTVVEVPVRVVRAVGEDLPAVARPSGPLLVAA